MTHATKIFCSSVPGLIKDCYHVMIAIAIFIATMGLHGIQRKFSHDVAATSKLNPTEAIHYKIIVVETILCGKNSIQGPVLLKLQFVGLQTTRPSIH